ncbi:HAMP domain-containing histidine kinase, partial [archaeon]
MLHTCRECLSSMTSTNTFMVMMINRCIDYTKASKGLKLVPKYETVALHDTLRMPLLCMKDIQDRVSVCVAAIPCRISKFVITDKQWLQENLLCLLSNAVKYSAGGKVQVRVRLESEEVGVGASVFSSRSPEMPSQSQRAHRAGEATFRSVLPEFSDAPHD